jgi:hypothetical protein
MSPSMVGEVAVVAVVGEYVCCSSAESSLRDSGTALVNTGQNQGKVCVVKDGSFRVTSR